MRVTLISIHSEVLSIGVRMLSACLRSAGHKVDLVFLPEIDVLMQEGNRAARQRQETVLSGVLNICQRSGLIGISFLTTGYPAAVKLTSYLKAKSTVPIVWGGPHATARTDGCLQHVDAVCVGEGEEAIVDLANLLETEKPYDNVQNMWVKSSHHTTKNPVRAPQESLDLLPVPDCDIMGHTILHKGLLLPLTVEIIRSRYPWNAANHSGFTYMMMASRGCPHRCAYCSSDFWKRLYGGSRYIRRRSIESVHAEFELAKEKLPLISAINFVDDNFASVSLAVLEEFLEGYRDRIGLPFTCMVSPLFADEARLEVLVRSGAYRIGMGIQTASQRILDMYHRHIPLPSTINAIRNLESVKPKMWEPRHTSYHFIVDNPYESSSDKIATLKFVLDYIPDRTSPTFFSLLPFPGTEIYDTLYRDGLLTNETTQVILKDVNRLEAGFIKYWLYCYYHGVPTSILRSLLKPRLVEFMDGERWGWMWTIIYKTLGASYRALGLLKRTMGTIIGTVFRKQGTDRHA